MDKAKDTIPRYTCGPSILAIPILAKIADNPSNKANTPNIMPAAILSHDE